MSSKTVKLTIRSFIFIWMSSIVFVQVVVGVPLPFRESQTIPSYQSKPLEPPPLGSRNFKHAHPHTHIYHQGSSVPNSKSHHHHAHEKGFIGGPALVPGRPKRHNEVHHGPSNDHLNHQNPYPHLNHYHHVEDRQHHDHQSFDNNNFEFQHHSMHLHQHQQQQQQLHNHVYPNNVHHHDSRAQNFHQPHQQMNHHHHPKDNPEFQESSEDHLLRQKRDAEAPNIFYFDNDWESDQKEKSGSKLFPHVVPNMNGYCTTLDCFEKSSSNNIHQAESSNWHVYDEVKVQDSVHPGSNSNNIRRRPNNNPPRVVQISPDQRHHSSSNRGESNGNDRNSMSNNKIPLPSQILIPPQQHQQQQQQAVPVEEPQGWNRHAADESWNQRGLNFLQQPNNIPTTEDFGQFYGQYPSIPANYLDFPDVLSTPHYNNGQYEINPRDSLPLDNSWDDFSSFFSASTPFAPSSSSGEDTSKTSPDAIRMRASGVSIGPDGLQIVKVVLNFSNEDDEETHLEVEPDQY